jgi:hypothetical protein
MASDPDAAPDPTTPRSQMHPTLTPHPPFELLVGHLLVIRLDDKPIFVG